MSPPRRPLERLPKAHLHVHLESTIRWTTLRELADRHGLPAPDRPDGFEGFRAFGDHNTLIRSCLRDPEDFARVARELCVDEAADGTRYLEVTFTAASHGERLGAPETPLEAVLAGLAEGRAASGIECRVILDHSRRRSVERAWQTLALAQRYAADGVVAIGLAGDESHQLAPFEPVLRAASDAGVHLVHHAGECAGPESIREAVGIGRAERLGHGIRVLDDAALVAEVRDRGIPLEVCPSSNVLLSVVPSLAAHPLPGLLDAGLVVTLNTDIPALTGASLSEEYARVADAFGFDDAVLAGLARAGVDASFAPADVKTELRAGIDGWLARSPAAREG